MITFTSAQLAGFIYPFMWPLARILSCIALVPLFNSRSIPQRVKIGLSIFIAILITPMLPPMPDVELGSTEGLLIMAQQILIGASIGFAMRIVFSSIELAGDLIGLQMGLGFAVFYSPNSNANLPVVAQIFGLYALLMLLAMNGHLMIVDIIVRSFEFLPVQLGLGQGINIAGMVKVGGMIFSTGLLLALPLVVTLFIVNLSLGVLTRAAPQLNLFAVGFPITLALGIFLLALAMPTIGHLIQQILDRSFEAMAMVLR